MMLERINAARVANGLQPLVEIAVLAKAAKDHAADLAETPRLIESRRWHEGSDGSSISDRLIRAGYRGARWKENVGWGFGGDESQDVRLVDGVAGASGCDSGDRRD